MEGTSPVWVGLILSAIVCLVLSMWAMALRRFSWSAFEQMHIARSRKLAVERCVENAPTIQTFLSLLTAMGVVILTHLVMVLFYSAGVTTTTLGRAILLSLGILIGAVILLVWLLPVLLTGGRAERIMVTASPVLRGVAGLAERLRHRSRSEEDSPAGPSVNRNHVTLSAAEEESESEEAHDLFRTALRFQNVHAGEIMTPRIDMISLDSTSSLEDARKVALEHGHSRLPVFEANRDHIVGILYVKDLLQHIESHGWDSACITDVIRKPYFIPETKSISELLQEFQKRKVHLAVVLDEYGGTAGIVTIEDVLEEIVGEIRDEYDIEEETLFEKEDDKTILVDAKIHVDALNDALNADIPEREDYETLSGFITYLLGRIPQQDEQIHTEGLRFTIVAADDRKVDKVRIEVLDPRQEPQE